LTRHPVARKGNDVFLTSALYQRHQVGQSHKDGVMTMAAETDPTRADSTQSRGHKVEAAGGERLHYLGMEFAIRASAESTGGAFSIVEEFHPLDTPLHIHHSHDELFYVLEGEHVFTVGGTEVQAGPGDVVFGDEKCAVASDWDRGRRRSDRRSTSRWANCWRSTAEP
jgi:mannose-6-phosphate isomerase-like protein (cupin superfamily)